MIKFLVFVALIAASHGVAACVCNKAATVAEAQAAGHKYIFKGDVVRIVETVTKYGVERQIVTFQITQLISGPAADQITVSYGGSTSCDLEKLDFRVGRSYIVSANQYVQVSATIPPGADSTPSYYAKYCNLRKRTSKGRG